MLVKRNLKAYSDGKLLALYHLGIMENAVLLWRMMFGIAKSGFECCIADALIYPKDSVIEGVIGMAVMFWRLINH